MGPASNVGARFRQRKISVKQTLPVLKQKDIPDFDIDDQQRELQHFETGVEKGEEEEHHLQQVINASAAKFKGANVEQVYIPTPDASKVWKDAPKFYHQQFVEPKEYIKFSATVEDTSGCPYNMDEIDEEFLVKMNKNFKVDERCTEDEFEILANKLDEIVDERQPFLSMDPQQILSFKEIEDYAFNPNPIPSLNSNFDLHQLLADKLHVKNFKTLYDAEPSSGKEPRSLKILFDLFGNLIYEHWKIRRIERGGKPVFPTLKFEDPSRKDDSNPYTCFRRREFRQARKTRRTDVQSIEKLKLLYKDLRRAENLFISIAERENKRSDLLNLQLNTFNLRAELKQIKRNENIKIDDDILVDKPKKKYLPLGYVSPPPTPAKVESEVKEKVKTKENPSNKQTKKQAKAESKKNSSRNNNGNNSSANNNNSHNNNNSSNNNNHHSNGNNNNNNNQNLNQSKGSQVVIQPYVKLPACKIPDIELTTVNTVLKDKLEGIKKAVSDKLIKRRLQDEGWINFTDDPYNPYFDMSNTGENEIEQKNHLPYSSIISSMFEVENSREINFSHIFNNNRHYSNNDSEIVKVNLFTGQVVKNDRHSYLPEFYDLIGENPKNVKFGETREEIEKQFNDKNRFNVSEVLFKIRKRHGRGGRIWMDRKRITDDKLFEEYLNLSDDEVGEVHEKMDLDIKDEAGNNNNSNNINTRNDESNNMTDSIGFANKKRKRINAYDSGRDSKKRIKSRFMFDAALPQMNPLDPSKLNQIGKQTQAIRFGCMLLSKAYDNMHQIRQKQILHHQQKLQQQQQLQREQLLREQKERERQQMQQLLLQQQKVQQQQQQQKQPNHDQQDNQNSNKSNSNGDSKSDKKNLDKRKEKDNNVDNDKVKEEKKKPTKERKSKKDNETKKVRTTKKSTPKTSNKPISEIPNSSPVKVKVESGNSVPNTVHKAEKENKVDKLLSSGSS